MKNHAKSKQEPNASKPNPLTGHLTNDGQPEDVQPPVWPGNDVDWKGER